MNLRETLALFVADFERSVFHAEGIEDVLLHVAAKLLASYGFHRLAREVDADAVFPFLAGVGDERHGERGVRAREDPGSSSLLKVARDVRVPEIVGAAGGVGEKAPEGNVAAGGACLRIAVGVEAFEHRGFRKFGEDGFDGRVQRQFAAFDLLHGAGAGDRLGH